MKPLTVDDVMAMEPCEEYTRRRVSKLWGRRKRLTLLEILDLDIPADDRLWCVTHAVDDHTARVFAADFAGHVLHIFEARHPDDRRPRECLEVVHRYLAGDATAPELAAARDAARDAARAAAKDAARDAAWAARAAAGEARDAAEAAAGDAWAVWAAAGDAGDAAEAAAAAAWAAAWEDEYKWQLSRVREGLTWIEENTR